MHGQTDRWMDGQTKKQMDRQDGWTDEQINRQMDRQTDGRAERQTVRKTDKRLTDR
jgi:hypothetical protein